MFCGQLIGAVSGCNGDTFAELWLLSGVLWGRDESWQMTISLTGMLLEGGLHVEQRLEVPFCCGGSRRHSFGTLFACIASLQHVFGWHLTPTNRGPFYPCIKKIKRALLDVKDNVDVGFSRISRTRYREIAIGDRLDFGSPPMPLGVKCGAA